MISLWLGLISVLLNGRKETTGRACTRPVSLPPITLHLRTTFRRHGAGRRCRRRRRAGSLRSFPAALEALQTADLLHVRHEDGVSRVARQLRADRDCLRGDQRDALPADEVCAG